MSIRMFVRMSIHMSIHMRHSERYKATSICIAPGTALSHALAHANIRAHTRRGPGTTIRNRWDEKGWNICVPFHCISRCATAVKRPTAPNLSINKFCLLWHLGQRSQTSFGVRHEGTEQHASYCYRKFFKGVGEHIFCCNIFSYYDISVIAA